MPAAAPAPPAPVAPLGPVGKAYLGYLLAVPLGATVAAMVTYTGPHGGPLPLIFFLGGTVAVAIYASVLVTFFEMPRQWWRVVLAIIDGPATIAIAAITLHGWQVLDLAAWFALAESLGVYLGIIALALLSARPTRAERRATLGIMGGCVATVALLVGWHVWPHLFDDWRGGAIFVIGVVEGAVLNYLTIGARFQGRSSQQALVPLLISIVGFFVAFGLGALLRFAPWAS